MKGKLKSISYEKYGKREIKLKEIGFPRWQHYSRLYKRYMVVTEDGTIFHFDDKNNLVLEGYVEVGEYTTKFSNGLSFYSCDYGVINKYNPNTNSYEIVGVPRSVYWGTETIGTDYYCAMVNASPPKLEFYNLDGIKVGEIDFSNTEVGSPFTHTWCNVRGDIFYGWSYYDPNKLVIAKLDGSYEVKDVSHLNLNWLDVVDMSPDNKFVYCVINAREFGILNLENLTFEKLYYSEYMDRLTVGISKNYKYCVITDIPEPEKCVAVIIDMDKKTYKTVELTYPGAGERPLNPLITSDGECIVAFHDFYEVFLAEVVDVKKSQLIDIIIAYRHWPFKFDINEFVI